MQYVMLIFAAVLLGADFAMNKIYQRTYGASLRVSLIFNMLSGIFSAVIFVILGGLKDGISMYSVIMASLSSLLVMLYNLIGFRILKVSGKISLYTMYVLAGGMVVPYIWGLMFMNEPFSIMRTVGLAVIICGITATNLTSDEEKSNTSAVLMCAAVFMINGAVSVVSKIHQTQTAYHCVNASGFVALSGMSKAVMAALALCFVKKEKGTFMKSQAIIIAAVSAVFGGVSYMLQLIGAVTLPATMLYPFVTGGGIIFSAVADLTIFKEKLSKKLVLGVALCFTGTLFFV